jgi:PAS domain S-box-containing protein
MALIEKNDEPVLHGLNPEKEDYSALMIAIVEQSNDAIICKSIDGTIRSWNRSSERLFGYSAVEAIGYNISLIIPPEKRYEERMILEKVHNNGVIDHYETLRMKKNGERIYVSITVSPLKDRAGNIIGISKIARDITARKNSELENNKELIFQRGEKQKIADELVIANKELVFETAEKEKRAAEFIITNKEFATSNVAKEKRTAELVFANEELTSQNKEELERATQLELVNKELESFSYSVSHDLRAPLRAIHGYARMLKELKGAQQDAETNRLMDNIINNAKRMGQLIDDLLTFSRLGRKELIRINVSMNDMVTAICEELKISQPSRNIKFCIHPLIAGKADNAAIKQVWLNLISNSIKYSMFTKEAIIEIGSEEKDNEVIYFVKDNGAGFDIRFVDKLFGIFQRLHSDEEFEGTGVGLAIVQRIIFKHGGRVWATGETGKGATFFFTLNKS